MSHGHGPNDFVSRETPLATRSAVTPACFPVTWLLAERRDSKNQDFVLVGHIDERELELLGKPNDEQDTDETKVKLQDEKINPLRQPSHFRWLDETYDS